MALDLLTLQVIRDKWAPARGRGAQGLSAYNLVRIRNLDLATA